MERLQLSRLAWQVSRVTLIADNQLADYWQVIHITTHTHNTCLLLALFPWHTTCLRFLVSFPRPALIVGMEWERWLFHSSHYMCTTLRLVFSGWILCLTGGRSGGATVTLSPIQWGLVGLGSDLVSSTRFFLCMWHLFARLLYHNIPLVAGSAPFLPPLTPVGTAGILACVPNYGQGSHTKPASPARRQKSLENKLQVSSAATS